MKNGPYTLIKAPDEYPGKRYRDKYVYEHHYIWWKEYGETPNGDDYLIHHINGDKRDNRIENLEKLSVQDHNKIHSRGKATIKINCFECGKEFELELRNYKSKLKYGQIRFFCCRKHQVITQQREIKLKRNTLP